VIDKKVVIRQDKLGKLKEGRSRGRKRLSLSRQETQLQRPTVYLDTGWKKGRGSVKSMGAAGKPRADFQKKSITAPSQE